MSRPAVPWAEARRRYEQGESVPALAARYGVTAGTVSRHARREQWGGAGRRPDVKPRLAQACRHLQCAAAALMAQAETGGDASVRDVKDLAALLRELAALEKTLEQERSLSVRVVLEPPLEDWAG